MNNQKIAFENEFIIVDNNNIPVNKIWWTKASVRILDILADRWHKKILENKSIWWELDACQIEIKNPLPHNSIESAQDELCELMSHVDWVVRNLWYRFSDGPVPSQKYTPIHSWLETHYPKIHDMLMKLWENVRKWTNIAGLHMHAQVDESFEKFAKVSNYVRDLLMKNNLGEILLSPERHSHYVWVVTWLQACWFMKWNYMPLWFKEWSDIKNSVLDKDWLPIFNYRYVQVKKPSNKYTTEIRTADGVTSESQLIASTNRMHELYLHAIDSNVPVY